MTAVPRVSGVLETSLYVEDLDRSRDFYQRLFGFEQFMCDGRMCALGVPGEQVLLLFRHGMTDEPAPGAGRLHPAASRQRRAASVLRHPLRRTGRVGVASGPFRHRDRKPAALAARRHQPVFPRSRRSFAGGRHARPVAEPLSTPSKLSPPPLEGLGCERTKAEVRTPLTPAARTPPRLVRSRPSPQGEGEHEGR